MAVNVKGFYLQARIVYIRDDTRGAERDEVCFEYEIGGLGQSEFRAI